MRDLWTVTEFTMKEMLRRKSFIISTLIILVIIIVGINIPNILKLFTDSSETGDKLLIVDSNKVFEGNLSSLEQMNTGYEVQISNENISFDDIKSKIENKEIDDAIIVEQTDDNIKIRYIVESTTMMAGVPENVISAINTIYSNMQISKLGLTEEQIASITPNFEYSLEQTEEQEVQGNVLAIMLLSIVLFYAIYFCAYQVSTSPKTIVLGKTVGIGIVGLLQVCLLVAVALITAYTCLEPGTLDSILDMSNFTPYLAIITIIYFILGYVAYALMYALTGSTVSKPEDIQSANGPVAIIAVIGFYLSYFTMMNPTSDLNVFASMLPISSPFCMPFRIMMGLASTTDVVISILILLVTIFIIAKVAIKIYSNAILNYGTKMSFADLIKVYRDKNN